ncbi:MAG TPA: hypothetical protein VGL81_01075 [Polyangiaceae bacterium]|jgi:signal transduction histidine kinase
MVTSWKPEASEARRGHLRVVRDDVSGLLAHDLKTPLAAIAMNLEFALGELGPNAPASVRGALEDCRDSNQDAVVLVTDVVEALQLASGQRRPHLAPVDVQGLLGAAVQRASRGAAARGATLVWTAEPTTIHGDVDLLERALGRLLDRGLRYARAGGSLRVSLKQRTIAIRVVNPDGAVMLLDSEVAAQSLATHFADAVLRAQGGSLRTELDADGAMVFVVSLPS